MSGFDESRFDQDVFDEVTVPTIVGGGGDVACVGFDCSLFDVGLFDEDIPIPVPQPPVRRDLVFEAGAIPSGRYQVRLYNTSGTQVAIFDDWNSLYYYRRLNDTDTHTFSIDGGSPKRDLFGVDVMIEVLRADPFNHVPWAVEYGGFHRTAQDQTTDRGDELFTSYGRGYMDLLHRREVLWYAGTSGDAKSGPADNVMKAYVRENATSDASVAAGRLRDGYMYGLSVDTDVGVGPPWSGTGSWKNLLDLIQSISKAALVDIDVLRTGPATFQFLTYYPRIGTDRTGAAGPPTAFAPGLGNMSEPYGVESHTEEANDIIALGSGDGTGRAFREVQDLVAQGSSPWNRVERTKDSRNSSTDDELDSVGVQQLNALRATRRVSFTVLQSRGVVYGRDYFLGDLIVARYKSLQVAKKIVGIEVTVANGTENIIIHFDDENAGAA